MPSLRLSSLLDKIKRSPNQDSEVAISPANYVLMTVVVLCRVARRTAHLVFQLLSLIRPINLALVAVCSSHPSSHCSSRQVGTTRRNETRPKPKSLYIHPKFGACAALLVLLLHQRYPFSSVHGIFGASRRVGNKIGYNCRIFIPDNCIVRVFKCPMPFDPSPTRGQNSDSPIR